MWVSCLLFLSDHRGVRLSPEYLLHCGKRVLREVLLLWHAWWDSILYFVLCSLAVLGLLPRPFMFNPLKIPWHATRRGVISSYKPFWKSVCYDITSRWTRPHRCHNRQISKRLLITPHLVACHGTFNISCLIGSQLNYLVIKCKLIKREFHTLKCPHPLPAQRTVEPLFCNSSVWLVPWQPCWCCTSDTSCAGTMTWPPLSTMPLWPCATWPPSWEPSWPTPGWGSLSECLGRSQRQFVVLL